jgi:hypothetical protein
MINTSTPHPHWILSVWSQSHPQTAVLWKRNDFLRFRFRLQKSFGFGSNFRSRSRQYLSQFINNNKFVQNHAISILESASFPRKLAFQL